MAENSEGTRSENNLLGVLCYLFGWVTGVIIWFSVGRTNAFLRFHAMQSILFSVALMIIFIVLSFLPVVGWIISGILGIAVLILWIMLMVKAYQGQRYKLPIIGDYAENWSK